MLKTNNILLFNTPDEIRNCFEEYSEDVSNTKELNNVVLTYSGITQPIKKIPAEDEKERNWLFEEIDFAINKIAEDKYTRKAIIYNLFPSKLDHNCLNNLHLYYRNGSLSMNVYIRSMNFDVNFHHDLYTFEKILNKACKELMLSKGKITLLIMSLHKFI